MEKEEHQLRMLGNNQIRCSPAQRALFLGNNSNLYFTETEENIMTSMRYKSKDLNKVRGANMAGGANRNLSEQGAEHHKVREWMY